MLITGEMLNGFNNPHEDQESWEMASNHLLNTYGLDISIVPEEIQQYLVNFTIDGASKATMGLISNLLKKQNEDID